MNAPTPSMAEAEKEIIEILKNHFFTACDAKDVLAEVSSKVDGMARLGK